ncbi:MAG: DnaJ domain-containing protein [Bacteroidales bacterium]|nr:DnaJ domain-containing protein [Bacteroidales bacterium]
MGCLFTGSFSLIFSIIGLIFGGFPGALLGFGLGVIIDLISGSRAQRRVSGHYYQAQDFTEHELMLAAYVARADNNRLLRSEMEYVRSFLAQNISADRVGPVMLRFRDILDSNIDLQAVCADLRQHATIYEKLVILQFLFGFAKADGSIRQEEIDAIQNISDLCGISRSNFEAIKSMFTGSYYQGDYQQTYGDSSFGGYTSQKSLDNDYKILEVSPDATDEEVKKAYRIAAKKHHPDKVSHLGEDVRKAAEIKFAQVNEAYERIKKARGMK